MKHILLALLALLAVSCTIEGTPTDQRFQDGAPVILGLTVADAIDQTGLNIIHADVAQKITATKRRDDSELLDRTLWRIIAQCESVLADGRLLVGVVRLDEWKSAGPAKYIDARDGSHSELNRSHLNLLRC